MSRTYRGEMKRIDVAKGVDSETKSIEQEARSQVETFMRMLEIYGPEEMLKRNNGGQSYKAAMLIRSEMLSRLNISLSGRVLDLGIGSGLTTACWLRLYPGIRRYAGLEVNKGYTSRIIPRVLGMTCPELESKITIIRASFDSIPLPDNSFDYIIEEDAFHHSTNISATIKESLRVLRKKGTLIMIDRFHPSAIRKNQLDFLLDAENPPQFWHNVGSPGSIGFTRRDLGETEIKICEWRKAIEDSGKELGKRLTIEFNKYWVYSERLVRYAEICNTYPWVERMRKGILPYLLEMPTEILALQARNNMGNMQKGEFLDLTGECRHTFFKCSKDEEVAAMSWMCRGVISVKSED